MRKVIITVEVSDEFTGTDNVLKGMIMHSLLDGMQSDWWNHFIEEQIIDIEVAGERE